MRNRVTLKYNTKLTNIIDVVKLIYESILHNRIELLRVLLKYMYKIPEKRKKKREQ